MNNIFEVGELKPVERLYRCKCDSYNYFLDGDTEHTCYFCLGKADNLVEGNYSKSWSLLVFLWEQEQKKLDKLVDDIFDSRKEFRVKIVRG